MEDQYNRDAIVAAAQLGVSVRQFWESPAGRLLISRAKQDILAGMHELAAVSPHKVEEIYEIQNRIKVAQNVQRWIEEAIFRGQQAASILESELNEPEFFDYQAYQQEEEQ